jgi:hypothetical protein
MESLISRAKSATPWNTLPPGSSMAIEPLHLLSGPALIKIWGAQ